MTGPTIAVHHVRAVLGGARRAGLDTVPLLQAAGIAPLLLGDDRARVAADRFARLVKELHRATDDEFLGLGPRPSRRGTFAMMGLACVGCPDLGTALERAVRFYGLFPGGPEMAVTMPCRNGEPRVPDRDDRNDRDDRDIRDASPARLAEFSLLSDLRPYPEGTFLAESVLIIWHRLSSWLIGRHIPLSDVCFVHPAPAHAHEYELLFDCAVRFGARRTAAVFDARWLAAPVVQDEAALAAMLRRAPADLLSRRGDGTTLTQRGRRTLRPALRRRDAAISALAAGREPIAALAARLGFSEDTAFHRAFRRWTGTTPGAYRLRPSAPALPGQQS
ncbi:AraC family transcriptional regulator [Streptomyces peucetius]|uniref:AraC family transcriptional regulator n=1 Tax=Streptomyces peucetius TaxID=1950 RepID=UPI0004CD5F65|nr:AraC family transcriptional regulator [Streptomyces peucetius]